MCTACQPAYDDFTEVWVKQANKQVRQSPPAALGYRDIAGCAVVPALC